MIFELTWHGPVGDVYYRVDADTEEDAMQEVCRALNEDDERWLRAHKIRPVWSEADEGNGSSYLPVAGERIVIGKYSEDNL